MDSTRPGAASTDVQPFLLKSIHELYSMPEESIRFLIENLLPTGGFSVLVGKPKVGKTTLVRQLAVAVAQGQPFLDRQTEQGKVLYLALAIELECGAIQSNLATPLKPLLNTK